MIISLGVMSRSATVEEWANRPFDGLCISQVTR
jgi:hypothetical protein